MLANVNVHEPKPPEDPDSPLSYSMEGFEGEPPAPLITRYWSPGWNSVQALNKFQQEVGGPLRGGDPGKRLLEPSRTGKAPYFREMSESFKPRNGEWLIVPLYHLFGSEELSVLSPGIAGRAPKSYLAMNPEDAARMHAKNGDTVELSLAAFKSQFQVKVSLELPAGMAGLPAGLAGPSGYVCPTFSAVEKK